MLKSYQEFLNENKINTDVNIFEINEVIFEDIETLTDVIVMSFSYLAIKGEDWTDIIDPYIDKKIIELNKKFGKETVTHIVQEIINKGNEPNYTAKGGTPYENGISDLIFNRYVSDFPLGGYLITLDENMFIKYSYGWHNKKYGKMAILQSFDTIEEFSNSAIRKYLENNLDMANNADDYVQHSGLILDLTHNENYDILGYPENRMFKTKEHFENNDYKIIEVLNSEDKSVVTDEDWKLFFDKCLERKKALNAPWQQLLKDNTELNINVDNYVPSKTAISKFDL